MTAKQEFIKLPESELEVMQIIWDMDRAGYKDIQPAHSEGDQSWVFIGRTDAEAETPILWPLMRRTESLEKTLGKIEGRRR